MKHLMQKEEASQFPTLPITVYCCNWMKISQRNNILVSRPTWRCYWYPEGNAGLEFNGKRYICDPDQLVLIPPNTPIRHLLFKPCNHFYIHVSAGFPFDSMSDQIFMIDLDERIRSIIGQINDKTRTFHQTQLLVSALFCSLLAQIPEPVWPSLTDLRIEQVLHRIQHAFHRPLDNNQLAKSVGLSRNAFIRLFRQHTGMSPKNYLIQYRLTQACQMLLYTDSTIDEIAMSCGFRDRNYLSRLFKLKLQSSPAQYRRSGLSLENA